MTGVQTCALPIFRSNIPAISDYVFYNIDDTFSSRARKAKDAGGGIIIGAENYGQGSSREHAALAPMYLGIQAVIARSFARIHRSNLINFGILPLIFDNPDDYGKIGQGDVLKIRDIKRSFEGAQRFEVEDLNNNETVICVSNFNEREKDIISSGGLLSYASRICSLKEKDQT